MSDPRPPFTALFLAERDAAAPEHGAVLHSVSLADAVERACVALRTGAPLDLSGVAQRCTAVDPPPHRLSLAAWVVADREAQRVELWVPRLCPRHDPPPRSGLPSCPPGDRTHPPHPVASCSCWCSGLAATDHVRLVTMPPAASLSAALRVILADPDAHPPRLEAALVWLRAAADAGDGVVDLWAALVADGVAAPEALRTASRIQSP
jgi:hypothetical protein